MSVVMVMMGVVGYTVNDPHLPQIGEFLATFDPEALDGRGRSTWTADPAEAMRFSDMAEALEFWKTVPKSRPIREDGQPNRPLTAFTVTFMEALDG